MMHILKNRYVDEDPTFVNGIQLCTFCDLQYIVKHIVKNLHFKNELKVYVFHIAGDVMVVEKYHIQEKSINLS